MLRTTLVTALPLLALASTTTLTATEAAGQLSEFDVIVDVRSQAAYEQSHVQGAVLQSRASLDGCETRKVAFYCSAGSASQSAADSYAAQTGEGSQAYAMVAVCMRKGGSNRASSADVAEVEVAAKKLPPA